MPHRQAAPHGRDLSMRRHDASPPHCLNATSLAAFRRSGIPGGSAWRGRTDCDCEKIPRRQAVPRARGTGEKV